jgi:hypothetical protein
MGMHSSTWKFLAKHKQHQIDEQLAMQGKHRTEGPGWYVTVQIDAPDGPETYKVWAVDDEDDPHHGHRTNPPLPEHMAHDSLDDIARGLALRFVENPKGRRMIYFLRRLLNEVERQAVARGSDTLGSGTISRNTRELGSLHAEAAMILDFIHQELE